MSIKTISARELQQLSQSKPNVVIIDVLPEETFAESHIASARNACVYGVDFLDRCARILPDHGTPCVVYDSSAASMASTTAAEKMAAAGYSNLYDFKGGLTEWSAAGLPIETVGRKSHSENFEVSGSGTFAIDTEESRIHWIGRNFGSEHTGTLRFSEGHLKIENGHFASGELTIDMRSMANDDIHDARMRQVLIDHLQSDDFFDVKRFPEARFVIEKTVPIAGAEIPLHYHVAGKLTMKEKTNELSFPCLVGMRDPKLIAEATIEIDRTRWNVTYGSTRFYEKLGKHFVGDLTTLRLHIEATRFSEGG